MEEHACRLIKTRGAEVWLAIPPGMLISILPSNRGCSDLPGLGYVGLWRVELQAASPYVPPASALACTDWSARVERLPRRGAGVVERGGLENRCALCVPWVRIPPSPPLNFDKMSYRRDFQHIQETCPCFPHMYVARCTMQQAATIRRGSAPVHARPDHATPCPSHAVPTGCHRRHAVVNKRRNRVASCKNARKRSPPSCRQT